MKFLFVLLFCSMLVSQNEFVVNINDLTTETQKSLDKGDANEMSLIWWIPVEFWVESFKKDPNMTDTQINEFGAILEKYNMFVIVDGQVGSFGGVTYTPKELIEDGLFLKNNETIISPLNLDDIDPDAKNFISMLKPLLANMLGAMGKNMNFYIFDGINIENSKRYFDPNIQGILELNILKNKVVWELPLSSLLEPTICSECNKKINGKYLFCPWDGTKFSTTN